MTGDADVWSAWGLALALMHTRVPGRQIWLANMAGNLGVMGTGAQLDVAHPEGEKMTSRAQRLTPLDGDAQDRTTQQCVAKVKAARQAIEGVGVDHASGLMDMGVNQATVYGELVAVARALDKIHDKMESRKPGYQWRHVC